ncbi:MAG: NAD(P)-binding domain-containing protein [Rhodocyclaceae bacterium]|nr:NAD(P)-binding domain-containing protein [Rhodocyclaceae bacterium]
MHLGFIGFGAMGRPMAEHLLRAGHVLSVWSRRSASAAALVAQGALWRASPAEVARHAEMVFTNVTGSADVEALAGELASGFAPGAIHVDFSTIAPNVARRIAARYAVRGVDFTKVREAMLHGSAGSRVLEVFGGRMATRDFAPGVEARLHHKDYALLMDEASRIGAALPVSVAVWQQLNAVMGRGWGKDDASSLLRVLEAGVEPGPAR